METNWIFWLIFNLFVLLMLALDLGVFHKKSEEVTVKDAITWSVIWIILSLGFNTIIYFWMGADSALEFLTGYFIEKALSVDNIFVFVLIFSYFQTPPKYQHRILFWGVLGALVMRVIFIFAGVALLERFHWTIYVFGGILLFTGIRMLFEKDKKIEPEKNPVIKISRKILPVTNMLYGEKFFVKINGKQFATPLFLVLILIEASDLIFAVDSIPAILAITQNEFIVYTSNVFAILGLRSLYFALAGVVHKFIFLSYGLSAILVFIGIKMVISPFYKLPIVVALLVVLIILVISIVASLLYKPKDVIKVEKDAEIEG